MTFVNDLDGAVSVQVNDVTVTVPGNGRTGPVRIQSYYPGAPSNGSTGQRTDDAYDIWYVADRSCGQADAGGDFLDPDTTTTIHIVVAPGDKCHSGAPKPALNIQWR